MEYYFFKIKILSAVAIAAATAKRPLPLRKPPASNGRKRLRESWVYTPEENGKKPVQLPVTPLASVFDSATILTKLRSLAWNYLPSKQVGCSEGGFVRPWELDPVLPQGEVPCVT
jgi:hypothetical protein